MDEAFDYSKDLLHSIWNLFKLVCSTIEIFFFFLGFWQQPAQTLTCERWERWECWDPWNSSLGSPVSNIASFFVIHCIEVKQTSWSGDEQATTTDLKVQDTGLSYIHFYYHLLAQMRYTGIHFQCQCLPDRCPAVSTLTSPYHILEDILYTLCCLVNYTHWSFLSSLCSPSVYTLHGACHSMGKIVNSKVPSCIYIPWSLSPYGRYTVQLMVPSCIYIFHSPKYTVIRPQFPIFLSAWQMPSCICTHRSPLLHERCTVHFMLPSCSHIPWSLTPMTDTVQFKVPRYIYTFWAHIPHERYSVKFMVPSYTFTPHYPKEVYRLQILL